MQKVHIFWDNSNIFIPAQYVAFRREGPFAEKAVRIHFDNLYRLASAGREVATAVCVGSVPPELRSVWDRLRDAGIDVELLERGRHTGTEQGVDQCLQVHMLRTLADVRKPEVAVLMTGDGAGYVSGTGFWADMERMARDGWGVEVLSWDIACNNGLRDWATQEGVYLRLEDYYESVTFTEGLRRVQPVSLKGRRTASPSSTAK